MQLLVILVTLFLATSLSMVANSQEASTTENLIRQSTFIFQGTVSKLNASTMGAVPATDATAVVRVDGLIEAPGLPPGLVGSEITVQLREPGATKPGQQAVFFTKGWLLGKSMAVIEVGRQPNERLSQVREQVTAVRQKMAEEELQNQLATTEVVVIGRVTSVRPAKIPHIGSEHDPDWYEAEIAVESLEKGQLPAHVVSLLFPHSDDVMWRMSPKFREGQRGIWLLHRNQARLPGIEDRFTALKPLDFHPLEEHKRIQRLLKSVD